MKEGYKDMDGVYETIERELLEMGAIKVAENTDKPKIIVIGRAYQPRYQPSIQPSIGPLEPVSHQEDLLYRFIINNFHSGDDTLIVEEVLEDPYMCLFCLKMGGFLYERERLQDLIYKNSFVTGLFYDTGENPFPSLTFVIVDNSKGTLEELIGYMKEDTRKNPLLQFRAYNIESKNV